MWGLIFSNVGFFFVCVQLPAALAYIYDGIFLGARDFRFLGIAMMY